MKFYKQTYDQPNLQMLRRADLQEWTRGFRKPEFVHLLFQLAGRIGQTQFTETRLSQSQHTVCGQAGEWFTGRQNKSCCG